MAVLPRLVLGVKSILAAAELETNAAEFAVEAEILVRVLEAFLPLFQYRRRFRNHVQVFHAVPVKVGARKHVNSHLYLTRRYRRRSILAGRRLRHYYDGLHAAFQPLYELIRVKLPRVLRVQPRKRGLQLRQDGVLYFLFYHFQLRLFQPYLRRLVATSGKGVSSFLKSSRSLHL